jgi:hypothetical protein
LARGKVQTTEDLAQFEGLCGATPTKTLTTRSPNLKPEKGATMRKWFRRFRKELSDQLWLLRNLPRINRELNEYLARGKDAE